jgi:hypothetical protein
MPMVVCDFMNLVFKEMGQAIVDLEVCNTTNRVNSTARLKHIHSPPRHTGQQSCPRRHHFTDVLLGLYYLLMYFARS